MTVTILQGFSKICYSFNFQTGFIFCFYNAVLVLDVQKSDPVTHIHTLILFQVLVSYWLRQNIELFPVLCSRSLLAIFFMCSSVYMLISSSWFIPPLYISFSVAINSSSKFVSLFLFCRKFICIIKKKKKSDSTY